MTYALCKVTEKIYGWKKCCDLWLAACAFLLLPEITKFNVEPKILASIISLT